MSTDISSPRVTRAFESKTAVAPRPRVAAPVFLVGAERSGTTLLRLMLDHHPSLAFLSDAFQFTVDLMGPKGKPWPDRDEAREALTEHWGFSALIESGLEIDPDLKYPDLVDSLLRQKRDRSGKAAVGAVVHYNFDRLLRIWPDARFIHLVRDGRDVGLSTIRMGWAGNMYTAVSRWIEAEKLWVDLSRVVPANRLLDVRYEDLVADVENGLGRICDFLGLSYDPAMLGYSETTTYEPPSTQSIGKWRSTLTATEVAMAESRIGAMLQERGYSLSGFEPTAPILSPRLDDWFQRMNFRRKRYGNLLLLGDFVSRRLPIGPLRKLVRDRIERIDRACLK